LHPLDFARGSVWRPAKHVPPFMLLERAREPRRRAANGDALDASTPEVYHSSNEQFRV
jgi:hypothetical protein